MFRTQYLARPVLSVCFVLLAATVVCAQPGSGPWLRAASNLEGTIVLITKFLAVIAIVGAAFAWVGDRHGSTFSTLAQLALGLSAALGARELIAMFY